MRLKNLGVGWRKPPIPKRMEGRTALVVLKKAVMVMYGYEYNGHPVSVTVWLDKLKTTIDPIRLEHCWVDYWKPL